MSRIDRPALVHLVRVDDVVTLTATAGVLQALLTRALENPSHLVVVPVDASASGLALDVAEAVKKERLACAQFAEDLIANGVVFLSAGEVADAIRRRGEP